MSFSLAIKLLPPPLPSNKMFFITSHNSLCMSFWNQRPYWTELGSHSGLSQSFFDCLEQSFLEGIIKPYEGTTLMSGKVCCVQYLLVFRRISGYTGVRLIPGLRRKDWILRALLLAVRTLWPHKVGSRVEIYSIRWWKFMLISDQAKDLVKNFVEGGDCMSPGADPGFWNGGWIFVIM